MSKHRTNRGRLALSLAVILSLTKGVKAIDKDAPTTPIGVEEGLSFAGKNIYGARLVDRVCEKRDVKGYFVQELGV